MEITSEPGEQSQDVPSQQPRLDLDHFHDGSSTFMVAPKVRPEDDRPLYNRNIPGVDDLPEATVPIPTSLPVTPAMPATEGLPAEGVPQPESPGSGEVAQPVELAVEPGSVIFGSTLSGKTPFLEEPRGHDLTDVVVKYEKPPFYIANKEPIPLSGAERDDADVRAMLDKYAKPAFDQVLRDPEALDPRGTFREWIEKTRDRLAEVERTDKNWKIEHGLAKYDDRPAREREEAAAGDEPEAQAPARGEEPRRRLHFLPLPKDFALPDLPERIADSLDDRQDPIHIIPSPEIIPSRPEFLLQDDLKEHEMQSLGAEPPIGEIEPDPQAAQEALIEATTAIRGLYDEAIARAKAAGEDTAQLEEGRDLLSYDALSGTTEPAADPRPDDATPAPAERETEQQSVNAGTESTVRGVSRAEGARAPGVAGIHDLRVREAEAIQVIADYFGTSADQMREVLDGLQMRGNAALGGWSIREGLRPSIGDRVTAAFNERTQASPTDEEPDVG